VAVVEPEDAEEIAILTFFPNQNLISKIICPFLTFQADN
jgi:hypothetical protein